MERNCHAVCVLCAAPSELYGCGSICLCFGYLRHEPRGVDYLLVCLENRLLDAHICIVGILDLQSQAASVSELIHCEA